MRADNKQRILNIRMNTLLIIFNLCSRPCGAQEFRFRDLQTIVVAHAPREQLARAYPDEEAEHALGCVFVYPALYQAEPVYIWA
jgi:hypothetical protein